MAKLVWYLNSKGIETIACCSGHSWHDESSPYIMFKNDAFKSISSAYYDTYISSSYKFDQNKLKEVFGDVFSYELDNKDSWTIRFDINNGKNWLYAAEFDTFAEFNSYICEMLFKLFKFIIDGYKLPKEET